MNIGDTTYDKIEDYLNGSLSEQDRILFEKELSTNTDLANKVSSHKIANEVIIQQRLLTIKSMIADEHSKAIEKNNQIKYGIGGAIIGSVLITALSYYYTIKTDEPTVVNQNTTSIVHLHPSNNNSLKNISKSNNNSKQNSSINKIEIPDSIHQKDLHSDHILSIPDENTQVIQLPQKSTIDVFEQTPTEVDLCKGISIRADMEVKRTCEDESTGAVIVSNIQGGKVPYSIEIIDHEKNILQNRSLPSGNYTVVISDANKCSTNYSNIEIKEKICDKDYSFNPFVGEVWNIPVYKLNGDLSIYEKSGLLYYKQSITANASESWNGYGSNNELETGYFVFIIHYSDGSSQRGSVTIVR